MQQDKLAINTYAYAKSGKRHCRGRNHMLAPGMSKYHPVLTFSSIVPRVEQAQFVPGQCDSGCGFWSQT